MVLKSYSFRDKRKKKVKKKRQRGSGLFTVGVGLVGLAVGLSAFNSVSN